MTTTTTAPATERKRKTITPNWEIQTRYDKLNAPVEVRPWAFKPKSGKIVNLDAKYAVIDNPLDGQRPKSWRLIPGSASNFHNWITLSWEQVQTVAKICREKDWPLKKGVAAVIDRDAFLKSQLAALAAAPEVYLSHTSQGRVEAAAAPTYDKATEAFFADVAKESAPAKPAAAKSEAKVG